MRISTEADSSLLMEQVLVEEIKFMVLRIERAQELLWMNVHESRRRGNHLVLHSKNVQCRSKRCCFCIQSFIIEVGPLSSVQPGDEVLDCGKGLGRRKRAVTGAVNKDLP